ncbi:RICIN domain-containing protein [Streptomyces sp. NBC_01537]|uniref:RICIN domain-containing protein n=1 Tax=Streptomyces sp. NBC_01537 TaxID=2903896 RepID=UPI003867D9CF
MRTTHTKHALAAALAGVLMAVVSPAIAHARSTQSSDPTTQSIQAEAWWIKNYKSGKVLDALSSANGAKVVQLTKATNVGLQNWFTILDEPYWSFENFESGLNLGIDGASTSVGAAAITATGSSNSNQDWTEDFSDYSGDYFALKNRKSGLCLGVSNASTLDGAQILQFTCDGTANQGWILTH